MSTHNIGFYGEIRKKYCLDIPHRSGAMNYYLEEGLIKNEYIFSKPIISR